MLNKDHSGPSTNFGSGSFDALEISRASFVATWSQMFPTSRASLWIFNRNVVEEHYNGNKDMHAGGKVPEDHFMHQPPMFKTSEAMAVKPST
ncbi:hypothetical protein BHYA_0040g00080 [Botrytis hyacinthi]|uniref:Uncharacterized protein n=1 Tax=Botrytis hyacinthi TaxID=278943 RepID=A0A4Z1GYR1_9HELO|nr:hypothetical protein BHYA_0040g00080 [Botrytis hyacinthi]